MVQGMDMWSHTSKMRNIMGAPQCKDFPKLGRLTLTKMSWKVKRHSGLSATRPKAQPYEDDVGLANSQASTGTHSTYFGKVR